MILLFKCPVCENNKFIHKLTCKDYTKSQEKFNIVSCETCGFTFTNPRPKDNSLPEYYKAEAYISHTNNSEGLFNWLYQKARKYAIKSKIKLLKQNNVIGEHLDVGCGTGEFLHACEKEGFKTSGVEPSKIARRQAIENFKLQVSENTDLLQYSDQKFDSITMWHVLEHVIKINETINQISRILKTTGKIVIAVPNHNSWDAKYYKEYWAAWDVPIHLWHFSKKTIVSLFEKHDFKLIKTRPMILDAYYVSLLSEEFKYGKKKFLKGFLIGLISNISAVLTKKGHSSTIYIFQKK